MKKILNSASKHDFETKIQKKKDIKDNSNRYKIGH